jgi:hypothetical protein
MANGLEKLTENETKRLALKKVRTNLALGALNFGIAAVCLHQLYNIITSPKVGDPFIDGLIMVVSAGCLSYAGVREYIEVYKKVKGNQ